MQQGPKRGQRPEKGSGTLKKGPEKKARKGVRNLKKMVPDPFVILPDPFVILETG
jgi:hypothetical protein